LSKEFQHPFEDFKNKTLSLQGSYRREKAKVKKSYGTEKDKN